MKRLSDVVVAALVLTALLPVILILIGIAAAETRTSGLFFQERIGRSGRPFRIAKIRSMREGSTLWDVTTADDPRVTRVGRLIRQWKLDELPQLLNVILGQMSLVGPRPEVPEIVDRFRDSFRIILLVRPGLTGPATLEFIDEEQTLSLADDPIDYYRRHILPRKIALNVRYVTDYSLRRDYQILIRTGISLLSKLFRPSKAFRA